MAARPLRVVVTGAAGLLGRHCAIRLHARNCAARQAGAPVPFEIRRLDHAGFAEDARLADALEGAEAVIHCAGINRAAPDLVEAGNIAIARRLAAACAVMPRPPRIVHMNSIHTGRDTPYGRGKAAAAELLRGAGGGFTDLVLPHVFGEGARPGHNSVTATLIQALHEGRAPVIDPGGEVALVHAGEVAEAAIAACSAAGEEELRPAGRQMTVAALWEKLRGFHRLQAQDIFPDVSGGFDLALFNAWRAVAPPAVRPLHLHEDTRGRLFEAVRGGGQVFVSTTLPGARRGDHFHLGKVERFVVLQGEAVIHLRPVLGERVTELRVGGAAPAALDIPPLTTHAIENAGAGPLLALFWAHAPFDPACPDTYAERVA